jgi:hypothetical protein
LEVKSQNENKEFNAEDTETQRALRRRKGFGEKAEDAEKKNKPNPSRPGVTWQLLLTWGPD